MSDSDVGYFSFKRIVLVVLILHFTLIATVSLQFNDQRSTLKHAPKASVSLGFRTAAAGVIARNEVQPQQAVEEVKKEVKKVEPITEPKVKPEPVKKPLPKPEVVKKPKVKPKPVKKKVKPKAVPKKALKPEPIKEPEIESPPEEVVEPIKKPLEAPEKEQKKAKKSSAQPLQKAQKQGAGGIDGSLDNKLKLRESGQNTQLTGDPDSARYDAELRQHLMKFKRYPRSLKIKRKEGEVEMRFTINQQGELLSSDIVKRTGDRAFDRAVRRLFERAKPFPQPPADASWQTREYRLLFSYKLD